jgi:hypothetical protein
MDITSNTFYKWTATYRKHYGSTVCVCVCVCVCGMLQVPLDVSLTQSVSTSVYTSTGTTVRILVSVYNRQYIRICRYRWHWQLTTRTTLLFFNTAFRNVAVNTDKIHILLDINFLHVMFS